MTKLPFIVISAVIVLLVGGLVLVVRADSRQLATWTSWCESQGGHVVKDTDVSTGTGYSSNGKPVVVTTTTTDYMCLSADGRILGTR